MVATIGKGTIAQYYLRRTEYYLTGQEPQGVWLSSSAALGIAAGEVVEADLFEISSRDLPTAAWSSPRILLSHPASGCRGPVRHRLSLL